jgi:hypothetical protein
MQLALENTRNAVLELQKYNTHLGEDPPPDPYFFGNVV